MRLCNLKKVWIYAVMTILLFPLFQGCGGGGITSPPYLADAPGYTGHLCGNVTSSGEPVEDGVVKLGTNSWYAVTDSQGDFFFDVNAQSIASFG